MKWAPKSLLNPSASLKLAASPAILLLASKRTNGIFFCRKKFAAVNPAKPAPKIAIGFFVSIFNKEIKVFVNGLLQCWKRGSGNDTSPTIIVQQKNQIRKVQLITLRG